MLVINSVLRYSKGASFTLDRRDMFHIIIIITVTIFFLLCAHDMSVDLLCSLLAFVL